MAACGLAVLCWFLLSRNPGGKVVKDRAKEAHDIILDFLVNHLTLNKLLNRDLVF